MKGMFCFIPCYMKECFASKKSTRDVSSRNSFEFLPIVFKQQNHCKQYIGGGALLKPGEDKAPSSGSAVQVMSSLCQLGLMPPHMALCHLLADPTCCGDVLLMAGVCKGMLWDRTDVDKLCYSKANQYRGR